MICLKLYLPYGPVCPSVGLPVGWLDGQSKFPKRTGRLLLPGSNGALLQQIITLQSLIKIKKNEDVNGPKDGPTGWRKTSIVCINATHLIAEKRGKEGLKGLLYGNGEMQLQILNVCAMQPYTPIPRQRKWWSKNWVRRFIYGQGVPYSLSD